MVTYHSWLKQKKNSKHIGPKTNKYFFFSKLFADAALYDSATYPNIQTAGKLEHTDGNQHRHEENMKLDTDRNASSFGTL